MFGSFFRHCGPLLAATGLLVAGCDRGKPAAPSSPPSATQPTTGPADRLVAVDDEDAASSPRALPDSATIGGWVKTHPVRVATKQVSTVLNQNVDHQIVFTYRIELAATCIYETGPTKAEVLYFRGETVFDAFGLFTTLSSQPLLYNDADGSMTAIDRRGDRIIMTAWQGYACVHISYTGELDDDAYADCDRLLKRIIFTLPPEDPPWLVRLIPVEIRGGSRVWAVRRFRALAAADHPALRQVYAASIDMEQRLGLGDEVALTVASLPIADGELPRVIFLVDYPNRAAAEDAYGRYQSAMERLNTELDANTLLAPPKGRFLAGTWTAEQESIEPLLPTMLELLPE